MKKTVSLLLFLVMLLAIPATAFAGYSYISDTDDKLVFPSPKNYYETPFQATAKALNEHSSIFIMPQAEAGHGELATLLDGTEVTVLAEQGGFFFFVTEDGWYGWNGTGWFRYDEDAAKGPKTNYVPHVESDNEELVLPEEGDYLKRPYGLRANSSIYLMPQPESGHGTIGSLREGKTVLLLALHNGFAFFRTTDGRYGWNGLSWFDSNNH